MPVPTNQDVLGVGNDLGYVVPLSLLLGVLEDVLFLPAQDDFGPLQHMLPDAFLVDNPGDALVQ